MSAHASRVSVNTADGSIADAAGSVFASAKHGATEIQTRVSEAFPATSRFLGRVVYKTSYAVSFGVMFPVMVVVRIVPKDNAMVHGLVDGALAARDRVHEWGTEPVAEDLHESAHEAVHASDNGTAHHAASTSHATRSRPQGEAGRDPQDHQARVAQEELNPDPRGRGRVRAATGRWIDVTDKRGPPYRAAIGVPRRARMKGPRACQ